MVHLLVHVAGEGLAGRGDLATVLDPRLNVLDEVAAQEGIRLGKPGFGEGPTVATEGVRVHAEPFGHPSHRSKDRARRHRRHGQASPAEQPARPSCTMEGLLFPLVRMSGALCMAAPHDGISDLALDVVDDCGLQLKERPSLHEG